MNFQSVPLEAINPFNCNGAWCAHRAEVGTGKQRTRNLWGAALKFIDKAHQDDRPFFVWFNTTRMHVWTRLAPKWRGSSGYGLYADGMKEHDYHVGLLLDKLEELGIDENTIVVYSTDNGSQTNTYPDGGSEPFRGEKGSTWEGGFRVPALVRWPGVVKEGSGTAETRSAVACL